MLLILDHGTTSVRACLFNKKGLMQNFSTREVTQIYPGPAEVSHDAKELWQLSLICMEELLEKSKLSFSSIEGIAVANQRETVLLWDKETGEPTDLAIVWQCRRTEKACQKLKEQEGLEDLILEKTGLVLDPYFSATKIAHLLQNPKAQDLLSQGRLLAGTIDSWICWNLSGRKLHVTDYTNASRTQIFNIQEKCWDKELLELFSIPESILARVVSAKDVVGKTAPQFTGGESLPIAGLVGDQQAALFGQACFAASTAKSTYGTGAFLMMNLGKRLSIEKTGILTTLAYGEEGELVYALEGAIFVAGAGIEWLKKQLAMISQYEEMDSLATSVSSTEGVSFIPAFAGFGAPRWKPSSRGAILGLDLHSSKAHIARAYLEAIAFQTVEVFSLMEMQAGIHLSALKIDGGLSRSSFLSQSLADHLQRKTLRSSDHESTARGAAFLLGLAIGYWTFSELEAMRRDDESFIPQISLREREER